MLIHQNAVESQTIKKQFVVKLKTFVAFAGLCLMFLTACGQKKLDSPSGPPSTAHPPQVSGVPVPAAERVGEYLHLLRGKKIAVVVNHTSMVGNAHLVDTLLAAGVEVVRVFAPEHGLRGTASDGETVQDGKDVKTGLPLRSLYGDKKKPSAEDLAGLEMVVFDIQDVGARFYTYISTLSYVMEACAENDLPLLVLDRPNPNGHYVDGPVLEPAFRSFVGLHPVPVVYGMTIGEYARMVNGEGWLANGAKCLLEVVPCAGYDHSTPYELPIKPSPNLPNQRAVLLYPSLCFFEGTVVSVGRGTSKQFQVYGTPKSVAGDFTFTPQPMEGAQKPPQQGKTCRGYDLSGVSVGDLMETKRIDLRYLLDFYRAYPEKENFFLKSGYFDTLAGTAKLREQLQAGKTEVEIRQSWSENIAKFKPVRKKYLLYHDFE